MVLIKHRELLKFGVVGGIAFLATVVVNYGLKYTVLWTKPITAMAIATIVATIVSYVLSKEWSFRTRGGRQPRHEALMFFLVNGVAVVVNLVPQWISHYTLHLATPYVSLLAQETADFVSAFIIGTMLGMIVRFLGYKYLVFPQADFRERRTLGDKVRTLRPANPNAVRSDEHVA